MLFLSCLSSRLFFVSKSTFGRLRPDLARLLVVLGRLRPDLAGFRSIFIALKLGDRFIFWPWAALGPPLGVPRRVLALFWMSKGVHVAIFKDFGIHFDRFWRPKCVSGLGLSSQVLSSLCLVWSIQV